MTDEDIGQRVKAAANAFCKALNEAGSVGLQIEVNFSPSQMATGSFATKRTGWHGGAILKRIIEI